VIAGAQTCNGLHKEILDSDNARKQPASMNSLSRFADPVYCIMRLIIGLLFACHGGPKILGYPPGGHAAAETLDFISGWIELAGGFLIAFGLIHPHRGFSFLRPDGRGLFHGARSEGLLSHQQCG
jgi:hypothetical protein